MIFLPKTGKRGKSANKEDELLPPPNLPLCFRACKEACFEVGQVPNLLPGAFSPIAILPNSIV